MKVTAFLKTDQPDKQKLFTVYVRINQGDSRRYFATKIKLKRSQWDKKKGVINHANEKDLNRQIKNLLDKHTESDAPAILFKDFASSYIKQCEENKWRGVHTIRHYRSQINMFLDFAGDELKLSEITTPLLNKYNKHLVDEGNDHNTIWNKFKTLHHFFTKAGIKAAPSEKYNYKQGIPTFLSKDEVMKIKKTTNKLDADNQLRKVGEWFYLQCMIGVRVGRLKTLDVERILREGEILIPAQKGGQPVSLPLTKEIKQLLKKVGPLNITIEEYNRQLKLIAAVAGIHKRLSSHVARHTFAMRLAELGKRVEVAQALLGHRKISTTQIYYKIQNKQIKEEFKGFGY